jgi:aminopeptidase N
MVSNIDAGPITQGYRLATHYAPEAPHALIYAKGAYVLQMLRMMMRDEKQKPPDAPFFDMMKDYVATWRGKNPSTDDFKKIVERHMTPFMNAAQTGTMDYFFDQWVYGTEVPRFKSNFSINRTPEGKYHIAGSVSQEQVSASFITVVPLYLDFGGGKLIRAAQVRLVGSAPQSLAFDLNVSSAPKEVIINARHDVLARD